MNRSTDLPDTAPSAPARPGEARRWSRDSYAIAGSAIFLFIVAYCWTSYVDTHEMIYLLGSRRVVDPGFLALDFTWGGRLSPTTFLFDHMIAPLWSFLDEFAIVNLGRLVTWGLLAWSVAFLGRALKLPAWSVFVGFALWLLWRQTLTTCGSPLEGFQPKSFAYPLMFFATAFVVRGEVARAGIFAGLGTAFHVIVGGWWCLALFTSLLFQRDRFPVKKLATFLLACAPFIAPVLLGVVRFHAAHVAAAERALMDRIYVTFAMPHCCDLDYFFNTFTRWFRAALVFAVASIAIFSWPHRREAKILGVFVVALILCFVAGEIAQRLQIHAFLALYPCQLANSLPALFLFAFVPAWIAMGPPSRRGGKALWSIAIVGSVWLVYNREVVDELIDMPKKLAYELWGNPWARPQVNEPLYAWIRTGTPRNSVFVTPFLPGFWPYAERAQVASIRHPPLDRRIIDWKARLEAMNGSRPFEKRGFDTADQLDSTERLLSIAQLARISRLYGATHYLIQGERPDLAPRLLHSAMGYSVYDLAGLPARRDSVVAVPSSGDIDSHR